MNQQDVSGGLEEFSLWVPKGYVMAGYPTLLEFQFMTADRPQFTLGTGTEISDIMIQFTKWVLESRLVRACEEGEDYRFGYSNHEKDNEIKGIGNSLNMGARFLDTRLGRTPSPDPAFKEYPSISPYAYVGNNPIRFIDPDGKRITDPQGRLAVYTKNGEIIFTKYADKDTRTIINLMSSTDIGKKVINQMVEQKHNIDLHIDHEKIQYFNPKTGKREDKPTSENKLMLGAAERYLTKDKELTRYKITIYEGSIKHSKNNAQEFERDGYKVKTSEKSVEDMIGAQGVHEGTHASDKGSQGFRDDIDKSKVEDLPNKNEAEHYKQLEKK